MKKPIIYEYFLKDGQLLKLTHNNVQQTASGLYKFKAGTSKHWAFLRYYRDFDVISNNHLFSFHDDIEKYRTMFIEHYQNRIQKEEKNLERLKIIYQRLKEQE